MEPLLEKRSIVVENHLITYYASHNEISNNTLLFLHGWKSESKQWLPIIPSFTRYQIICLDLPGFGKSELPKKTFSLNEYALIVERFIEKLRIKHITLIGHSFGGAIAIRLVTMKPALINNLILVNSSGIRHGSKKKMLKKIIAKIIRPLFIFPFMKPIRKKLYQIMGAEDYITTPQLRQTYLTIIREDLTPLLSRVTTKTLIVWGAKDTETPLEMGKTMHRLIAKSQLIVLPNAGHFSYLDEKEKFIDNINKFLIK